MSSVQMDHPEEEGGLTGADDTLERRQERNFPHWEFSSPPHYWVFFYRVLLFPPTSQEGN